MTVNTHAHMSIAYRVACCVAWQIAVLAVVGTPLMAADDSATNDDALQDDAVKARKVMEQEIGRASCRERV